MLVAVFDHQPVGFMVGRRVAANDEGTFDAEIYNIGVVTRFHRRGIGRKLIDNFFAWATDNKIVNVWLEVRAANSIAANFYKRYGFEEMVTRKGFYSDPVDDAIIMKAEVSGYYNVLNKESLK
jgi:[ribosomal protein S18]-alanine N-acetyltransferase